MTSPDPCHAKIGDRFTGIATAAMHLDRAPATDAEWEWVRDHAVPRLLPGGRVYAREGRLVATVHADSRVELHRHEPATVQEPR